MLLKSKAFAKFAVRNNNTNGVQYNTLRIELTNTSEDSTRSNNKVESSSIPQSRFHSTSINSSKKSTHNYGIDIMRCWMCFEVILCHFWTPEGSGNFILDFLKDSRCLAVPCFIFISFLLCAHSLDSVHLTRHVLLKRLNRLVTPIWVWAITYYVFINLNIIISGQGDCMPVTSLIGQLILGHVYNTPMWFMNVMVALTLTIVLINRVVPHRLLIIVNAILAILVLVFVISGLNYSCFGELSFQLRYPIGRYFECLPYAYIANIIYLSGFKIPEDSTKKLWGIFLFIGFVIIWQIPQFIDNKNTFGYGTLKQYLQTTILVMSFWIIPFNRMWKFLQNIISWIARITLGIYCIHMAVGSKCVELFTSLKLPINSMFMCIIIFLISMILCRLIYLLPWKWAKAAVS